jgi:hypothetical protein
MKGSGSFGKLFIFIVLIGAIAGTLIGDIAGSNVAILGFLKTSYAFGTSAPITLNLRVITVTFGINFYINLMTIIGIIVAIILYRKY